VYGNEFAYFEFVEPHGAQIIRHQFRARVCEVRWHVEPARVAAPSQWPANFEPYLRTPTALTTDGGFQDVLRTIVPERQGAARDLAATLQWVDQHLRYDHVNASLRADALFAFRNRCGHCSDYHGLCAAMGRALGYPTRVAYGLNLFPKNSPSHCKLEAYLPPYGWVSFDVSETQRLIEAIRKDPKLDTSAKERLCLAARQRLLSGFRDNTWLRVTQGSDYDLAPPASQRVAVVRTIYAEADGVPLPDPDPANPNQREFSWMTVHDYKADRAVAYPFKAWQTLDGAK
jgi:transglutaminase-like putative cysteine protease